MIIPKYLEENDLIGITAPSAGLEDMVDITRLESAKMNLTERGFTLTETENVKQCFKGRSGTGYERWRELSKLITAEKVSYIVAATGGDFLMEMLEYVDFDEISKNPKWIQGYSDVTALLYPITTISDVATVYAGNIGDYGMALWHDAVKNNLKILRGVEVVQRPFDMYEEEYRKKITGYEGYSLTRKVSYEYINMEQGKEITGRLLGGCLDVLIMLCGTKFDKTGDFIKKYKDDGIIWYFESFDLSSARVTTALWQLKMAGWLDTARAIIFGRPCFFRKDYDIDFREAVTSVVGGLNIPIILGADIGHRPPRLTMINGGMARISYDREFNLRYLR